MNKDISDRVDIRVEVKYLKQESDQIKGSHAFAYTITIKNNSDSWCQLLNRHWVITDADGSTEEVQGEGVVGEQPELNPGQGFRYSSYAVIETPIGSMHGIYEFQRKDGVKFEVSIPAFSLSQNELVH